MMQETPAAKKGDWKATTLEHYVKAHFYQVSSLI